MHMATPSSQPRNPSERLSIVVFSGATATIQNTAPLVTSNQARRRHGLSLLRGGEGADTLRPQRLAAPVKIYIEAFSAHPLERDAQELYAAPDGYLNVAGEFLPQRQSESDTPVYEAVLNPEDGLYMLPYMARQRDGSAWETAGAHPAAPSEQYRQTFFADAFRLFEEIDRFGLDDMGHNNMLARNAGFTFVRAAPSGGYTQGLAADLRTDAGLGAIPPERRGEGFFTYSPLHLAHGPARTTLARLTNAVQEALDSGLYDGAIWLEGSPALEETMYWLSLLIDTDVPLCGNSSQRPHGAVSADGDRNIVDSVRYIGSRIWADREGRDSIGAVLVQDEMIFAARDVQKADARPGGYVVTGGHGGVVGGVVAPQDPVLTFLPNKLHTRESQVNIRRLPQQTLGVRATSAGVARSDIVLKDSDGRLLDDAIPTVTLCKYSRYGMDDLSDNPAQQVEITARIARNLEVGGLAGFVLEGNAPFGRTDESMTAALRTAVFSGMPVVCVGRGNAEGMVPKLSEDVLLAGSNLTATKARLLLMASLMRFGSTPPAVDPARPSPSEHHAVMAHLRQFQEVFDTH
jgi:L-asparaginase